MNKFLATLACIILLASLFIFSKKYLGLGAQAYIYGFPLVLMDATKNGAMAEAEVNRLTHRMLLPDHNFRAVVRPNNDTIYSIAWIDLAGSPQVLSLPDMGQRYFVMPFMDAWSNVFARVGSSTTGQQAQDIILLGPDWQGDVPPGLHVIRAPTKHLWLIGRSQLNGKSDMPVLEKKLAKMALTDLDSFLNGERFFSQTVLTQSHSDAIARVLALKPNQYFERFNQLVGQQSPAAADKETIDALRQVNIGAGVEYAAAPAALRWLLEKGADIAQQKLLAQKDVDRSSLNNWSIIREGIGRYGTDYKTRAFVALIGLGALPPEEASYPNAFKDSKGERLSGHHKYRLRFGPGEEPPVDAFWSITLYDRDGFMVENSINRFSIGDRDNLSYNSDGSLDLLIQHQRPELDSNWLPAPPGEFAVTMRLYLPKKSFLSGQWKPPGIERLE